MTTQVNEFLETLEEESIWGFDTETTGLQAYKGDSIFAISFSCKDKSFYFDIREYSREILEKVLTAFFAKEDFLVFIHNAKFDMHMVSTFVPSISFLAKIYCTEVMARIYENFHFSYTLADVAKRFNVAKIDEPKKWIQKNKAYRKVVNSLGEEEKIPEYFRVPIEIIRPYAIRDAELVLFLGKQLYTNIEYDNKIKLSLYKDKSLLQVLDSESELTKVLFHVEQKGVLIDKDYTKNLLDSGKKRVIELEDALKSMCNGSFTDSSRFLAPFLQNYTEDMLKIPFTATGLLSLTDEVLSTLQNPLAKSLQEKRGVYKEVGTYYSTFIDLIDSNNYIHTNFKQAGAKTGRMSCTSPNLQNIPKGDEDTNEGMHIRRCFSIPKEYLWISMDYKAQEYFMLFDQANQLDIIEQIKSGLDPHSATAQMVGCTRKIAKTVNFSMVYGSGTAKLCQTIGNPTISLEKLQALYFFMRGLKMDQEMQRNLKEITEEQREINIIELRKAQEIKDTYFEKLPKVREYIKAVIDKARNVGWVCNWLGRVYQFEKAFSYKAPNYIIQGGAADVVKRAMITCHSILQGSRSRLIMQVHDELNFYIHREETHLIDLLSKAMCDSYPCKTLPLQVSISVSNKSWGDLQKYEKGRDYFQGTSV